MSDWTRFFAEHRARHPHLGLPEPEHPLGRPLYRTVAAELARLGVDVAAATAASEALILEPAKSKALHWKALAELAVASMEARRPGRPRHDLSTHDGAKAASAGCDRCGGEGLAVVWHPRPDPVARLPPTVAADCVCALGRRNRAGRKPDLLARIPDLADVLVGRSVWLPESPNCRGYVDA